MKKFWEEFKTFAMKGNVLDLAVAVVIGTAFSAIVNSLVGNIITPLVGILFNGIDFSNAVWTIRGVAIQYGIFIQSVFDFFVIALSIFIFIRVLEKFRHKKKEEETEEPKVDPKEKLLVEIRDILREQNENNK
ncbi:large conductance mechanosensitive channel protein MscL [Ornithinibacillus bavariensis]|uniref:Large-conductance mechanosensitive channel n=1 Tax=Ornithinibacillus bavariensis TaxID=545502 RepID=A0A919X631_9BACI|nr:large conductance mechanosensitive channel protein MscL [Ornithinibacillus bavariensis]GIO25538.1 large-conductance mechanosensitive channel [Ornithinibacillus bavariensis]HAM82087.1 large conductance mechanosensitive channel protein MscL [Ornithinibacillus sp.]